MAQGFTLPYGFYTNPVCRLAEQRRQPMKGKITDVEVFDRALPETEIKLIYEITQLKADKERLDWLQKQVSYSDVCSHLDWDFNSVDNLRQAIDKAMEKGKGE